MGIDYYAGISSAPRVEGAAPALPHETVAAIATAIYGDLITIDDVADYISTHTTYSESGEEESYDAWRRLMNNEKWATIERFWWSGASTVTLGRRFGASKILQEFGCPDWNEPDGSFEDVDATAELVATSLGQDAASLMQRIGFDYVYWG